MKKHIGYALLAGLLFFTACKTKQQALGTVELKEKTGTTLLKDVQSQEIKYRDISSKMNFKLSSADSKNSKAIGGTVKIIKDKAVQVSFRLLGIEGMRVTITTDSIFIIDRMGRKYATESLENIQEKVNFNYYNIQALFTNALFIPGQKKIEKSDYNRFRIGLAQDNYIIGMSDDNVHYNFAVDGNDRIISTHIFKNNAEQIVWSYKDFIIDDKHVYPTEMLANISFKDLKFNLEMSYSKLDIDKDITIDYSLPARYTKVSVTDIIKSYLN